jgi:hypothetical protein
LKQIGRAQVSLIFPDKTPSAEGALTNPGLASATKTQEASRSIDKFGVLLK